MKVSLTDILSHVRLEHAQVPSTTTFLHVADLPRRILTLNLKCFIGIISFYVSFLTILHKMTKSKYFYPEVGLLRSADLRWLENYYEWEIL